MFQTENKKSMKISLKSFFLIIVATALFILAVAIVLLKANNNDTSLSKSDDKYEAEIVMQHLYYDGQYLNEDVSLNQYDKSGVCQKKNIPIKSVVKGNKCLALFFSNCCTDCVKMEIAMLRKLPCRDNIIFMVDHNLAKYLNKNNFIRSGFYEINNGKLCGVIDDESELPLLFYTSDLRIMTSCVVSTSTKDYTRKFYEFINTKL